MHLSQVDFLRHILAECEYLLRESASNDFDDFVKDERLTKAICRSLEIIGEASSKIHPDLVPILSLYQSRGTQRDMKVTLRKKKLEGDKVRLYLDLYDPSNYAQKRKRESIGLFLYTNPKTPIDKNHNKETLQLAENIKAKRQLELQSSANGFKSRELLKANFLDYFQKLTEERKKSAGNYGNWDSTLKHLKKHFGDYLPFNAIVTTFVSKNNQLQRRSLLLIP